MLRVLTLNVWGRGGDWERRRSALRTGFKELDPDVLLLQETIVGNGYDQVTDLLGDDYHVLHQQARAADGSGISIASRQPLAEPTEIDLHLTERTGDFPCGALLAHIQAPPEIGPVLVVNHFPSYQPELEHERELQAVRVAGAVEELVHRRDLHVVVGGDLDADRDSSSLRFFTGRQSLGGASVCYRDAWDWADPTAPSETFSGDNPLMNDPHWPFRRIDYLLVRARRGGRPTLKVAQCRRAFDQPLDGQWLSDHFGVVADLEPMGA